MLFCIQPLSHLLLNGFLLPLLRLRERVSSGCPLVHPELPSAKQSTLLGSGAIVEIAKLQYQLYYLSPSGIYSLLVFYVYKDYGIKTILGVSINLLEEIVNPWLVSISILMWIMMPAIIAWFIFKKANLFS
ncbi:MAG: hypothetical protein QXJ69_06510 [Desulfurococcaceae archaeon]